jgi:selenide,water dikinase
MINTERRKRVMSRSIKLGHCVCDPKQPCPCPIFKEKNICLCAGERLDSPVGPVQLTKLVHKAGCASKIDQAFLKAALGGLSVPDHPNVLVGVPAGDDAGIYDLGNGQCLVQTVDVFTPIVDDSYLFGQIAAANSVSDVYAMGGRPLTALSVIGFPAREVPDAALTDILRGGIDKMNEAGVPIVGGHSINDPQIKAGFAVTGLIDKDKVVTNAAAQPGDLLILTKPLGTGIISFAWQIGRTAEANMNAAAQSMCSLNKAAAELMGELGASAATDVTGFSLMGHLSEMALRSGVDVELTWDALPWLPGVLEAAAQGILPGAIERNKESCGHAVIAGDGVSGLMLDLCFDAQTSGGLLIAINPARADELLSRLHAAGVTAAECIGYVTGKGTGKVRVISEGTRKLEPVASSLCHPGPGSGIQTHAKTAAVAEPQTQACCAPQSTEACCAPASTGDDCTGDIEKAFLGFLAKAGRPGQFDAVTKQAINIALSVATRCEPCLKAHIEKARQKGFTEDEIDEAAWMGVAFAGSPAMMLYNKLKADVGSQ